MTKALILVDYQNEWLDENSDYYVGDISKELDNTNKLISFCREKGYKIIFTQHVEEESDDAFAPNSKNIKIMSEIDIQKEDVIITKNKISSFYNTNLEKELEDVDEIVICGILTNLCVRSLVQDAYDRDFEITVVKDCCVAFDKQTQEFTFKDLKATREEIEFVDLVEFLQ
ncbi:cysteine hydrolase [Candidatus Woesearchaeota archaeon]|nr:cysteine hydrolase [Candidatus Woesearchaeota archaeon]